MAFEADLAVALAKLRNTMTWLAVSLMLSLVWVLGSILVLSAFCFPLVARFVNYGVRGVSGHPFYSVPGCPRFDISCRNGWVSIYAVGVIFSVIFVGVAVRQGISVSCAMILLCVQTTRRLSECMTVHKFSSRPFSAILGFLGQLYYILAALSLFCDSATTARSASSQFRLLRLLIGLGVFTYASLAQHTQHKILAKTKPLVGKYGVPRGGLFEVVWCPHYLMEILIYISLVLVDPGILAGAMLMFVVANLSQSAVRAKKWYSDTFPRDVLPKQRFAIFPHLL